MEGLIPCPSLPAQEKMGSHPFSIPIPPHSQHMRMRNAHVRTEGWCFRIPVTRSLCPKLIISPLLGSPPSVDGRARSVSEKALSLLRPPSPTSSATTATATGVSPFCSGEGCAAAVRRCGGDPDPLLLSVAAAAWLPPPSKISRTSRSAEARRQSRTLAAVSTTMVLLLLLPLAPLPPCVLCPCPCRWPVCGGLLDV